jgi:uncharacterized protein YkwD/LysM repeat protein
MQVDSMNRYNITHRLTASQHLLYNRGMKASKPHTLSAASIHWALSITLIFLVLSLYPSGKALANTSAEDDIPTPAEVIEAVNELRENNGLNTLSVHPVLMQVAQTEANGIASGSNGHWRPPGLTLGQWLITLGYPLSGDLTQDGYRSENWIAADNAKSAIKAWMGDAEHTNTMLSPDRSDIGVGIAVSGDQIYIVLVTALQTASGKMQSNAYLILTQVSSSTGEAKGFMPLQYIKPVVLSTARPDGDVFHKVQYGQSLWSIAIAYKTTIDQIRAWNNLGEDVTVYENQYLLVQRNATQPPPATSTATAEPSLPALTDTPAPPSALLSASPTMEMQSLPTVSGKNDPPGAVPVGMRIGIMAALVVLGGLMSLFVIQKAK